MERNDFLSLCAQCWPIFENMRVAELVRYLNRTRDRSLARVWGDCRLCGAGPCQQPAAMEAAAELPASVVLTTRRTLVCHEQLDGRRPPTKRWRVRYADEDEDTTTKPPPKKKRPIPPTHHLYRGKSGRFESLPPGVEGPLAARGRRRAKEPTTEDQNALRSSTSVSDAVAVPPCLVAESPSESSVDWFPQDTLDGVELLDVPRRFSADAFLPPLFDMTDGDGYSPDNGLYAL